MPCLLCLHYWLAVSTGVPPVLLLLLDMPPQVLLLDMPLVGHTVIPLVYLLVIPLAYLLVIPLVYLLSISQTLVTYK